MSASLLLVFLVGITSCGGDGTTDPPPPPPPPPPAPVAPVAVGSIPAQVLTAGQTVTVDVTPFFSDPDGGALTYTASSSAPAVLSVSISGSNLTVEAVAPGTATVTVTATDPDGLTATQSAEVTVEAGNQAPEAVGAIPAQTMTAGQTATVDVSAFFSDPDGDDLTYAAESSNTDAATVGISGSSLTVTAVAAGTATVTVTASDPDGLSAAQSAEVTVEAANRAPGAVGTIPPQTMTAGQTATVDVSAFFSDPDGDDLTYAAESSNTDAATVGISGSSLTVTAVAAGTATVTVTASDPDGLTATQSAGVTVEAANRAPGAVGAIPAQTMTAGQTAMVDVSAFFSDPDGDDLAYAAESSNTDAATVGISGSSLTVTAVAAGTATVTVTASDPDGLSAAQSAGVTVEAANRAPEAVGAIPPQTMTAGQTATVDVSAFFSDPDGDDLTYAAESSNTDAATVGISGSSLTVTAVAAGTATVTVTASDPDGLSAAQSAEVTVEAANRAPGAVGTIPPQTMTAGQTATVDVSAFFSDPDGDDLTYAAESSNTDAATVGISGSSLTVTAVAAGTATVTVTASDPDGLSATQSAGVTVEAANRAPEAVNTIPAYSVDVGGAVQVNLAPYFSDADGDALSYAASSSNEDAATVSVEGALATISGVADGMAVVTVTASDPDGASASQTISVTVGDGDSSNTPPVAQGTIPDHSVAAGGTLNVDVSGYFSDADGDELTYMASSSNADVATATIDGATVTISGVGGGRAVITVTASDGEATVAQGFNVTVEAANRAPVALGTIPAQTVKQFDAVTVNMFWFFRDPDGDELGYAAESSNTAAVPVSMEGSVLTLTAVAAGTATVTVTASDPDGLTATHNLEVIAEEGGGFRDHFDTAASLDDWDLFRSTAEVFDGVLYVTPDGTGDIGTADRMFDAPVTDWKVGVSMARGTAGEGVSAWFVMGHPRFSFWRLSIGPFGKNNYQLHVWDRASANEDKYVLITTVSGYSDEINDEVNEFTEMTLLHRNGQFALLAGGVELFRLNSANQTFRGVDLDHMLESVETIWLGAVSEGTASFDWAYASGTEIGASAANPAGPPPMGASPRLPEGAKQARPGNRTDTIRPGKGR
ncbi:Ig-like domain-containing protein [Candidatus Palauibacter sp.]|uniref:Ig-like domain-containing protein n=1 Tax=Candidatus Palauibacter sp. TaxID=3101350 RepID=UPI003B5B27AF